MADSYQVGSATLRSSEIKRQISNAKVAKSANNDEIKKKKKMLAEYDSQQKKYDAGIDAKIAKYKEKKKKEKDEEKKKAYDEKIKELRQQKKDYDAQIKERKASIDTAIAELEENNKAIDKTLAKLESQLQKLIAQEQKSKRTKTINKVVGSAMNYRMGDAKRNGRFSYDGNNFDVFVTSFSYSYSLEKKGSSQARQRQTIYPFRATQSDLNVVLQFMSREELLSFGLYARDYHLAVTSTAGLVGSAVPNMTFRLKLDGEHVLKYGVALPSIPIAQSNDSIGPTMRLTLKILKDMSGDMDFVNDVITSKAYSNMTKMIRESAAKQKTADAPSSGKSDDSYVGDKADDKGGAFTSSGGGKTDEKQQYTGTGIMAGASNVSLNNLLDWSWTW